MVWVCSRASFDSDRARSLRDCMLQLLNGKSVSVEGGNKEIIIAFYARIRRTKRTKAFAQDDENPVSALRENEKIQEDCYVSMLVVIGTLL